MPLVLLVLYHAFCVPTMAQKMSTLQRFSDFLEERQLMHLPGKRVSYTEDQFLISGSRHGGVNCAEVAWIGG